MQKKITVGMLAHAFVIMADTSVIPCDETIYVMDILSIKKKYYSNKVSL